MNLKRLAAAAAIAAGVGMSALTSGIGLVSAAPSDPPRQPRPSNRIRWAAAGHSRRKMLEVRAFGAGNPRGGGGSRSAPCPPPTAGLTEQAFPLRNRCKSPLSG